MPVGKNKKKTVFLSLLFNPMSLKKHAAHNFVSFLVDISHKALSFILFCKVFL